MRNSADMGDDGEPVTLRDRGVTFIEVLITIVLLGTVVVGILAVTRTSIIASKTSKEAATVESALIAAAERVERADRAVVPVCDLSGPIYAAAQTKLGVPLAEAPGYVTIEYDHLVGTTWVDGACPGGTPQPNLVQRITISMEHPDSGLTRSVEVIKGDV